ncbi:MAG TPA: TauD/TfdA family dioxygenase [Pseudomonadales bacterium]|nr:TauD/TfdA family dioxygenase [Pseudomonadales bacterium]
MELLPLTPAIGAEVLGFDPTVPMDAATCNAFETALAERGVLFFRDLDMTPVQQRDFAAAFGPLQSHPAYGTVAGTSEVTILESTAEKPSKIEMWHTDMTFRRDPPKITMLHARIIPPTGGDTLWSSMTAAFDGLSDRLQSFLSSLTGVHDFSWGFKESLAEPGGRERLAEAVAANPPVEHPVVVTHPLTGRRGLYVNSLFTVAIKGMKQRESRALLDLLFAHVVEPEYVVRFRWAANSFAVWDNRCTQHKPVNDYFPAHRLMHRVTVEGEAPAAWGALTGAREAV